MIALEEIIRRLPYRYPMLLVDRVTEVAPGHRLCARKAITASEPWFRASAAGRTTGSGPLAYPPVLLMESLCQAAGLLAAWDDPKPSVLTGKVMLLGALSDVTVQAPVLPGCLLEHEVRLRRDFQDAFLFEGTTRVDGHTVLHIGQMLMAVRPAALVTGRSATVGEGASP